MSILINGRMLVLSLVLIFVISANLLLYLSKTRTFKIRKHAAIDAMGEAVSRAVELGRPVVFTPGIGGLYSTKYAADTAAGLAVAGYLAKEYVAPMKAELIVPVSSAQVLPVLENIVQQGLAAGGAPELYKPQETVRFVASTQMAYAAAYVGILYREKVASTIMVGMFAGEVSMMCEEGSRTGCFQVAASTNVYQIPLMICMVDFMMFGEDMMAATAWISEDPAQITTIIANDLMKYIGIAAAWIGAILVTLGNDTFLRFWGSF